ncbi:hypothetical protein KKA03_07150 [archaeon]|nr:hypothetical protein [archaeon]
MGIRERIKKLVAGGARFFSPLVTLAWIVVFIVILWMAVSFLLGFGPIGWIITAVLSVGIAFKVVDKLIN